MLLSEKADILAIVKSHFSKATDGDGELMWEQLKGFEFMDSKRAIEAHRIEKGERAWRPDLKRVVFLAASYRNDRRKAVKERIVDFIRREARRSGDDRFGPSEDDKTVLMLHFGEAWQLTSDVADDDGRNAARAYILLHARMAFGEIGMSLEDAEAHARDCVGLQPGEKIMKAKMFKPMPEVPKSYDALKALAVAEHENPSPEPKPRNQVEQALSVPVQAGAA